MWDVDLGTSSCMCWAGCHSAGICAVLYSPLTDMVSVLDVVHARTQSLREFRLVTGGLQEERKVAYRTPVARMSGIGYEHVVLCVQLACCLLLLCFAQDVQQFDA
jgi:hypothetical protein